MLEAESWKLKVESKKLKAASPRLEAGSWKFETRRLSIPEKIGTSCPEDMETSGIRADIFHDALHRDN